MATTHKLVRVQEKGQVTIPVAIRKRLDLKKGDLVAVEETPDGVLITSQIAIVDRALAEIGDALREQGLTIEDMIERGRAIREELYRERYGVIGTERSQDFPRQQRPLRRRVLDHRIRARFAGRSDSGPSSGRRF